MTDLNAIILSIEVKNEIIFSDIDLYYHFFMSKSSYNKQIEYDKYDHRMEVWLL